MITKDLKQELEAEKRARLLIELDYFKKYYLDDVTEFDANNNPKINPKALILPQYQPFYYDRHPIKVAHSGRNSGKSVNIIRSLLLLMLSHRNMVILCAREIQKSIKRSSYAEIEKQIREMKLERFFVLTDENISCPLTGGVMHFIGLYRNIESVKGISDINIVWFEEAETLTMESITLTMDTVREGGAECWFTFNPKNPTNAVCQLFIENEPPENTLIVSTNYDLNPFVSKSKRKAIEELREKDFNQYDHRYGGNYLNISEYNLFPLDLIKESINRVHDTPTGVIKAGLDIARNGSDNMVLSIVRGNRQIGCYSWPYTPNFVVFAEIVIPILLQYNVDVLTGDTIGMGGGLLDIIESRIGKNCTIIYFDAARSSPLSKYAKMKDQAMGELQQWLMNGGSIMDIKELREDLQVITYDHNGNDEITIVTKKRLKKDGYRSHDWADSLALAIFGSPRVRKINTDDLSRR